MDKPGPDREQQAYEDKHVHQVYEQIAPHFSSTRYKVRFRCSRDLLWRKDESRALVITDILQPWPIVEKFLRELPDGAIGVDVGCGNGKYLAVNPRIFIVGSDR
jgi:tRNA (uracil-5-)-methyltransferase TRM9